MNRSLPSEGPRMSFLDKEQHLQGLGQGLGEAGQTAQRAEWRPTGPEPLSDPLSGKGQSPDHV